MNQSDPRMRMTEHNGSVTAFKIVRANEVKIREFVGDLIFKMADAHKFDQAPLSQGNGTNKRPGWEDVIACYWVSVMSWGYSLLFPPPFFVVD